MLPASSPATISTFFLSGDGHSRYHHKAGLTVEAVLHFDTYRTGMTVTNALMRTLNLEPHPICPAWSYRLHPRQPVCLWTSAQEVVL